MKLELAEYYDFKTNTLRTEEINVNVPRQCCHCSETGTQNVVTLAFSNVEKSIPRSNVLVTACPLCGMLSVHYMGLKENDYEPFLDRYSSYPKIKKTTVFTEVIRDNYSRFVHIFEQAEKAETENLDELVGMGYRKALEFLVTDYLISKKIDDATEDWLTNPDVTLGQKIKKIPSQRINELAKASSYLGNDYTHYTRKHDEYGIEDLKAIINVLVMEIESDIVYQRSLEIINKPK